MRRCFKDYNTEKEFTKNGFVKLPFYSKQEVEHVVDEIKTLSPSDNFRAFQKNGIPEQSYHCTFFDSNIEYRRSVYEILNKFYAKFIEKHFDNYKVIQANLFLKPAGSGLVIPHQNLTIVEEDKFASISLWCPRINTTKENGTLEVVKGSHRHFMKYRSTNISYPLAKFFLGQGEKYLEPVDCAAGEVIVLDDSIIHTTSINKTATDRDVIHAMAVPLEARVNFFDLTEDYKHVIRYEVEDLFWQYYLPGSKLTGIEPTEKIMYTEAGYSVHSFSKDLVTARLANDKQSKESNKPLGFQLK